VVPFRIQDERAIQGAASEIARGRVPGGLPPRFAVSASRCAFERKLAPPAAIARTVLTHLARVAARANNQPVLSAAA
jgi:hypothetical protein